MGHLGLPEARLVLYRLRAAGLISPQRAAGTFQEQAPAYAGNTQPAYPATQMPQQPQQVGPVRRLLNALRRLTGGNA